MNSLGQEQLRFLADNKASPCISIYLPTHPSGEEMQGDRIRLKNLLDRAEPMLLAEGLSPFAARDLLAAARLLLTDEEFWRLRGRGLAVLVAPGVFRHFRLPDCFDEALVVSGRFQIKPLIPHASGQYDFFLLALTQNGAKLYKGSQAALRELPVPGMPANLKEAVDLETGERGEQVHAGGKHGIGKQAAVFHGQGGQPDAHKGDLAQYFQAVWHAVRPIVHEERIPLIVAAVDYLLPIFRAACDYPYLLERGIGGNPDGRSEQDLHARAVTAIAPILEGVRKEAADKYRRLAGTGKASEDLREVLQSAAQGKIDTLFVERNSHQWGRFEEREQTVVLHERFQTGDDDLLDLAAMKTLAGRGRVYVVPRGEMPCRESAAAVYRY
jgi:Bacterial archaeo-eukaryotic release factor family 7